jgi:hypothetical protein
VSWVLLGNTAALDHPTQGGTSGSYDTTGSDLFVVTMTTVGGAGTFTPVNADNKGNTYTARGSTYYPFTQVTVLYVANPSCGSGTIFDFTQVVSGSYPGVIVSWWSGSKPSTPYDVENSNTGVGVTSLATGSITPSQDGDLLIASADIDDGAVTGIGIDSGFSTVAFSPWDGNKEGTCQAYLVQGSAAAINPTWSWTTAQNANVSITAFKAAPGGAIACAITAGASVAADLKGAGALACAVSAAASCTAALTGTGALACAASAGGSVSATLTGNGALACTIAGSSSVTAACAAAGQWICTIASGAAISAALTGSGALACAAAGSSLVTCSLTGSGALAVVILGSSSVSAPVVTPTIAVVTVCMSTVSATLHDASGVHFFGTTRAATAGYVRAATSGYVRSMTAREVERRPL